MFNIFKNNYKLSAGDLRKLQRNKIKPCVILFLDGFGIAPHSAGNAITQANKPNFSKYYQNYPHTELIAAGESVGLPANEAGNSEVGHLTAGVGRVIYQSLPRINLSIKDESFYENRAFIQAVAHTRKYASKIHIMGMVSSGTVHSSNDHLYALLEFCRRSGIGGVNLHLFTDGRDAPPTDSINIISEIEKKLLGTDIAKIRTITGRYYAMDRDARWERTQKAYDLITLGKGNYANSAIQAIQDSYAKNITDEFIEPVTINYTDNKYPGVSDNDAIIFFNFRIDRPRQLAMAFTIADFENIKQVEFGYLPHELRSQKNETIGSKTFKRQRVVKNLFFVSMTEYQKNLPVSAIAFPPQEITNTLGETIAKAGLKQIHLAESEKERMVTFYFNGMKEQRLPNEDVLIVPSPKVAVYDKKPEMSVYKIASEFKKAVLKDIYNFFVVNFANPDMVAHTGNLDATIKAVEAVDEATGVLVEATLVSGGTVLITADHGNAEELITYPVGTFFYTSESGSKNTEHSNNPVPLFVLNNNLQGKMDILQAGGSLSDVAPTALAVMGLSVPSEMTGKNLLASK